MRVEIFHQRCLVFFQMYMLWKNWDVSPDIFFLCVFKCTYYERIETFHQRNCLYVFKCMPKCYFCFVAYIILQFIMCSTSHDVIFAFKYYVAKVLWTPFFKRNRISKPKKERNIGGKIIVCKVQYLYRGRYEDSFHISFISQFNSNETIKYKR